MGREIYKRRKHTVEPRIGHIKHNMGVRRFLRRGIEKVKTEWMMVCSAVNLGILLRHWDEVVKALQKTTRGGSALRRIRPPSDTAQPTST